MVTIRITIDPLKIKRYFKDNLGAPFVICFQVLLLSCAGLLIQGNSALANELAIYAFYSLVIGVVLQLISYVRYNKETIWQGDEMEKNHTIGG